MSAEDYSDIEHYLVMSSMTEPSLARLRPYFPRWRRQLLENGVKRVSLHDTLASDLMIMLIHNAIPKSMQDQSVMHDHRNLVFAVGAPVLGTRGWKA